MSSINGAEIENFSEDIREALKVDKTIENEKELEKIVSKIFFLGVRRGKSTAADLLQQAIRLLEK